ncbi:MAG: hypothetical protein RLZ09_2373 [Pseudomonadota bacterium]
MQHESSHTKEHHVNKEDDDSLTASSQPVNHIENPEKV